MSSDIDFKKAFDNYYPVLESVRQVGLYYAGKLPDNFYPSGKAELLICSDVVGRLIEAIHRADKTLGIVKEK